MYSPDGMKDSVRFLQKWDTLVAKDGKSCESGEIGHSKSIWASFWGKRWKNLQNDQNWPFGANLSHFFGKNCHCGSFWATSVWNDLKSWNTQKNCQCISIKILLRYLSFCWNLTKIAHFELIHATLVAKIAIVGHFELLQCEMIRKSWKTQKNADVPPPRIKIFEISPKMRCFGGKSCEISHSKSIWASFWGKRWKKMLNDQNWPFGANLSHFFGKFAIVGHFYPFQCEMIWKSW